MDPLEGASRALPGLRRIVVNVGDAHLLALLRIHVARFEARTGGPAEAMRHHAAVMAILERTPSLWLRGLLEVDACVSLMLLGDLDAAVKAAEAAYRLSEESGHFRTPVAAAVNLSHIFDRKGDLVSGKRHLDRVLRLASTNRHLAGAGARYLGELADHGRGLLGVTKVLHEAVVQAKVDGASRPTLGCDR